MIRNNRELRRRIGPLVIALGGIISAASLAHASLYGWNPQVRPPVTLEAAHATALKSLGDNKAGYVLASALLLGNEKQDASAGTWNLTFVDRTAKSRYFHMTIQGKSSWGEPNTPLANEKFVAGIKSLDDVERVLKASIFLADDAKFVRSESSLTVSAKLREFQVHEQLPSGEYAAVATTVMGPAAGGFRLRVAVLDAKQFVVTLPKAPYWFIQRSVYQGFRDGEQVVVDWEEELYKETLTNGRELRDLLGKPSTHWYPPDRPSVTFELAFVAATTVLGKDQPQYYCIGADYDAMPKPQWEFEFAASDGSQRTIAVDAQKQAVVASQIKPVFKVDKKVTSLAEAQRVLPEFLQSQGYKVEVQRSEAGRFTLGTAPQTFAMHEWEKEGYSSQTREVVGPRSDGLQVTIREDSRANFLKLAERYSSFGRSHIVESSPYFETLTRAYRTPDQDRVLVVKVQSGRRFDETIARERLHSLFGEEVATSAANVRTALPHFALSLLACS